MSNIELTVTRGLRLHFHLNVGYEGTYFNIRLRNKDKVLIHILNRLNWKIPLPEEDYFNKDSVTLEAINVKEDARKALRALLKIRSMRRKEAERLKNLSARDLCKELVLKAFIS